MQRLSPEAQKNKNAYIARYNRDMYDRITIQMPKGTKEKWKKAAKMEGLSLRAWIEGAADDRMNKMI